MNFLRGIYWRDENACPGERFGVLHSVEQPVVSAVAQPVCFPTAILLRICKM
jgi:hypothetical protein